MRKDMADLMIINVSTEVYEILDMTGFTDMLTVEKAFRRLSLEGCELIALCKQRLSGLLPQVEQLYY